MVSRNLNCEYLFGVATERFEQGDIEIAFTLVTLVACYRPASFDVLLLLAKCTAKKMRAREAARILGRLQSFFPDSLAIDNSVVEIVRFASASLNELLAAENYDEAEQLAVALIRLPYVNAGAVAECFYAQNNLARCDRIADGLIRRDPRTYHRLKGLCAVHQRHTDGIQPHLSRYLALESDPDLKVEAMLHLAGPLIWETDTDRMEAGMEALISSLPPEDVLTGDWSVYYRSILANIDYPFLVGKSLQAGPFPGLRGLAVGNRFVNTIQFAEVCSPGVQKTVFLVVADGVYINRYASYFLKSLFRHGGDNVIAHVHVVDVRPDEYASIVARLSAHCEDPARLVVSFDNINWLSLTGQAFPPPNKTDLTREGQFRITGYQCARFMMLPVIQSLYRCPIVVSDIDLILQRSPEEFLTRCRMDDVVLNCSGYTRSIGASIVANLVYYNATEGARRYVMACASFLVAKLASGRVGVNLDQVALFLTYKRLLKIGGCGMAFFHATDVNNNMYKKWEENPFLFFSFFNGWGFDETSVPGA